MIEMSPSFFRTSVGLMTIGSVIMMIIIMFIFVYTGTFSSVLEINMQITVENSMAIATEKCRLILLLQRMTQIEDSMATIVLNSSKII